MRIQILAVRLILGMLFGVLLTRVFFPKSSIWLVPLIGGLLVFFAYSFEYLHRKDR